MHLAAACVKRIRFSCVLLGRFPKTETANPDERELLEPAMKETSSAPTLLTVDISNGDLMREENGNYYSRSRV